MARDLTQWQILTELEPVAGQALDRHLSMARDWHPHDYIPWDDGRNFAMLGGADWEPGQSRLSEVAKAALVTNLLTEDNLPSYHREISANYSPDGAWGTWVGRWTAEEAHHSIVLRDYLVVTRGVDPVALENARMIHMTTGFHTPRLAHDQILERDVGIYDLRQHLEEVLQPVIRHWNILDRNDFGPRGEQARERLADYLSDLETVQVPRFEEHRDRALARARA